MSPMRVMVAKEIGDGKYEYMGGGFDESIQTWTQLINVKPGKYIAFVEFNWHRPSVKDTATFRTYGQKQVSH